MGVVQARQVGDVVELDLAGPGRRTMAVPADAQVRVERVTTGEAPEQAERPGSGIAYHPADPPRR